MNIMWNFNTNERYLILFVFAINATSFLFFLFDKIKAMRKTWRIPEFNLFLLALLGGGVGSSMAMLIFNHKTSKKRFRLGIPLIILINGVSLLFIINLFKK